MIRAAIERAWYSGRGWTALLLPLAWLYGAVVAIRRVAYARGWLASRHPGVPVLIVGNITVGGTGKTPLVAELAARARARGRRPGIVTRGYGGRAGERPQRVTAGADVRVVGDEPLLLARHAACPVMVSPDRVAAAEVLVSEAGVDCILSDDGLQHYRLRRDAEVVVRDGGRGDGNGWLLPAGPLREPVWRMRLADLSLTQGAAGDFRLCPGAWRRVDGVDQQRPFASLAGQRAHAVAGIGDPARFFAMLTAAGIEVLTHPFSDHHAFQPAELAFEDDLPVLMTEKDAVKCAAFAAPDWWYVPVAATFTAEAETAVDALLDRWLA
ncbi:MAG: tetraacyldisaccharide 4'-kinase [Salinisphaeraceae bacterium]